MSSKTCKDCAAWQHNTYRDWSYCAQGQGDICSGNSKACKYFKSAIVFQKITESPEVLAKKMVYEIRSTDPMFGGTYYWWCSTIIPGEKWAKREDAIAATLAKLKEVKNEQ
jgi:hypothetical protein